MISNTVTAGAAQCADRAEDGLREIENECDNADIFIMARRALGLQYFDEDGTLRDPDGERSIFDDVDE